MGNPDVDFSTFCNFALNYEILEMAEIIKIKRGLNIPLKGNVENFIPKRIKPASVAISPADFPGFTWKLVVKTGDLVEKGSPLLTDKETGRIALTSPCNGVVEEIRRGERRKIEAVVIKNSGLDTQALKIDTPADNGEALIETLCKTGLWAMMRQRPYDIVPNPETKPRDIFITAFDTSPLATPLIDASMQQDLESGIEALATLTSGKVYLGVAFGSGITSKTAEVVEYQGPHPAGNVGTQIAAIKPVNKGETVWTLDARTAVRIGTIVSKGVIDMAAEVAVCGSEVENPAIINTIIGADIASILKHFNLRRNEGALRIISGNVLTGIKSDPESGFLRYPYRQITIIREGDKADEFMGWASMNPKKYSIKRSFPSFFSKPSKKFEFDSRLKGGRRAMILSGEYDKMIPMDIYPEFLIKAILANDISRMEKLGIYEIAPEDFALAEFVDTSKLPLQEIVKEGLDKLRKEM